MKVIVGKRLESPKACSREKSLNLDQETLSVHCCGRGALFSTASYLITLKTLIQPVVAVPPNVRFDLHRLASLRVRDFLSLVGLDIDSLGMEEQFVLRVPPSVAERIDRLLSENASSSDDKSLDLSFTDDGRSGMFVIGNDHFPASLVDLPCIVESYKTYDDNVLIKTADIGQMIMVREEGDTAPDVVEYRHGLTPPMRDARRRRFRREPDLNPELVQRVEKDLVNIMAGGTAENVDILSLFSLIPVLNQWIRSIRHTIKPSILASMAENIYLPFVCTYHQNFCDQSLTYGSHVEVVEHEEDADENARKKPAPAPAAKPDVPEAVPNTEEPDRSDSDDSDDSV
ncbi:hypothetical protein HHK36_017506 [Tetracentron sinense]|uniref:TAFII55 protein conserved region domain-containing protein n=1 Tax=Tetracentron sinense TaxID=13715 RepID=A0A834Z2W7_TETSI|nr:hypothetical protein HHK36_017506 [Tetracentron sinense]